MLNLKELLIKEEIIVAPGCFDPLSAKIIEAIGFKSAYLGGWAVGAHLAVTEPLTTLTEMVDVSRRITSATTIPLVVDAGSAFGHLPMVDRTVSGFEQANVAAIQLEDQVVPKRMHYHKGEIDLISTDEMMQKLERAVEVRKTKDFVIIARTDAGRNKEEPFSKAIERANLYASSGADMVMVFPRNEEEMKLAPKEIDYPLVYVASEGLGRPIPTPEEARALGYKMVIYPLTPVLSAFTQIKETYQTLMETGKSGFTAEQTSRLSKEIMDIISIDELVSLEKSIKSN
ncbi:isocitrate lyase/PEP mutase family protein [Halalkalibacter oceani]|uniref:isocitrate lyase/PEP mutase family protein n=1 Tax=Halalkalibacter oceani TaxID=1653776 RepID=UPI003397AB34